MKYTRHVPLTKRLQRRKWKDRALVALFGLVIVLIIGLPLFNAATNGRLY